MNVPNKIIVHHTGGTDADPLADTSSHTADTINAWHKTRWPLFTSKVFKNANGDFYHVGYHYVIEKTGKVVQCRDTSEEGAHVLGQNLSSIGIVLAGNFDATMPTKRQEQSFRRLANELMAKYTVIKPTNIYPHRKYANKSCYGFNLSDTYFTELLKSEYVEPVVKDLQHQVVQLATQLLALLSSKRYSKRQVK